MLTSAVSFSRSVPLTQRAAREPSLGTRTDERWFSWMWAGLMTSSDDDDETISCRGDEDLRLNLISKRLVQSDLKPRGTPGGPGSGSGSGPGEPLRAAAKLTQVFRSQRGRGGRGRGDSCDGGEVAADDLTCRRLIGTRWWGGGGGSRRSPDMKLRPRSSCRFLTGACTFQRTLRKKTAPATNIQG